MKTPLTTIVEELAKLTEQEQTEAEQNKVADDVDSTKISRAKLYAPHPAEDAVKAFLKSLTTEDLLALEAVMYAGRDGINDPKQVITEYLNGAYESEESRDSAIEALSSKACRMTYIRDAMKLLDADFINDMPVMIDISIPPEDA